MKENGVGLEFRTRVFDICNELFAKDEKITTRYIMALVPEIQSLATAHKHIKSWREELDANQKSMMDTLGFSEAFVKNFTEEIARHSAAAELYYKGVYETEKERNNEILADLNEIESTYLRQQAVQQGLKDSNEELKRELSLAQKTIDELKNSHAMELSELDTELKQSRDLNEDLRIQIATQTIITDTAKTECSLAKKQVNGLKDSLEKTITENKSLISQLSMIETKLSSREERFDELKTTLADQRSDNDLLRQQILELQRINSSSAAINSELKVDLQRAEQNSSHLDRLNANLESSLERATKRTEDYEQIINEQKQQLSESDKLTNMVKEENESLLQEITNLKNELQLKNSPNDESESPS